MEPSYKFMDHCKVLKNNDRVVFVNRNTGEWLKISEQCYRILNLGTGKMSESQLIARLADKEDQEYFKKLFEKLRSMGLISSSEKADEYCQNIKQIYFAVTHRCNLKCIHCCFNAAFGSDKDILSTDEVLNIVDKIIACSPELITFTGGEPLLRKDFIKILEYTAERFNGKISLSTNATLINSRNVKILSSLLSSIDISLDGVDEESCSLLRGPGVFDKVMESVRLLKENGLDKISLSMVLVDGNRHLEDEFRKLNEKLGTMPLIRNFSPTGRGKINKDLLQKEAVSKKPKTLTFSESELKSIRKGLKSCCCGAGRNQFIINYDGSIYPCGLLIKDDYKMGNVNEIRDIKSYMNIIAGKSPAYKALNQIEPDMFHRCRDCNVNLFCWSCLNDIEQIKNSPLEDFQERCLSRKQLLSKFIWDA